MSSVTLFGKNILLLVPHPDDEVVACCAAIDHAQKEGAKIFALYLTHGCIARQTLWPWQRKSYEKFVARRRKEAEAVAQFLNITPLNWPLRPARHLWREMDCAHKEILTAIEQNNIDQIWGPAFEGGNPDHDALNAIGSLFLPSPRGRGRGRGGEAGDADAHILKDNTQSFSPLPNPPRKGEGIPFVLEFTEYNFLGGKAQSQLFPTPNNTEKLIILTPDEQRKKGEALKLYKSEKGNLNYVKTERECYRPLASYDYSKAPHVGKLWYTRFQWVPFKHPRVDFTKPEEVAEKIVEFLKKL